MLLTEFYSAVAQLSFTLLGLWIVAIEMGPGDVLRRPDLRRTVTNVSLGFLVPGVIALGSLLAIESLVMWRVAFGVGGAAGAVAALRLALSQEGATGPVPRAMWWVSAVIYALFAVVAFVRPSFELAGTPVAPITQEGTLLTIQLLLGAYASWRVFTMPRTD